MRSAAKEALGGQTRELPQTVEVGRCEAGLDDIARGPASASSAADPYTLNTTNLPSGEPVGSATNASALGKHHCMTPHASLSIT